LGHVRAISGLGVSASSGRLLVTYDETGFSQAAWTQNEPLQAKVLSR
jgi:hypothetical protein